MDGLIGLRQNINSTESRVRDLNVLERMDSKVQQDRDKEVVAQQQEQLMFEQMYAKAGTFLDKDRKRINKKIASSQQIVTEHLSRTGGSKRMFMEQGGFSALNKIKNDILQSDESVQFGENQKNLAKILEAKEKGLGHLISPTDLKSLEDYNANEEGGPISYNGIMSEVEIPDSKNFDFGTDIPLEKILSNGSNMMKIMNNYAINYPDRPPLDPSKNQDDYLKIVAFAKKMGYGGTGSNTTRIREQMIRDRQKAVYDRKSSLAKKDPTISYLNEVNVLKSGIINKGLKVADINKSKEEGGYDGKLLDTLAEKDPTIKKLLGEDFTETSRNRSLSEEGVDITDFMPESGPLAKAREFGIYLTRDNMGLKESKRILEHNTFDIASVVFPENGGFTIQDGTLQNFTPDSEMYRMDGVMITGDNALDPDDHKGNYQILGITTAVKSPMKSDGKPALLVNAYDDNGDLDKSSTAKLDEFYKSEVELTTVMAMKNENGDLFYKEIDISRPQIKTVMSNTLADDDDLTETVKQDNDSAAMLQNIAKNSKEEQIIFQGAINTLDEKIFNDDIFKTEGERYWGQGSAGEDNRADLMKGFYMAFDYVGNSYQRNADYPDGNPAVNMTTTQQAVDAELFTTLMGEGGGNIDENLKSYDQGYTDEKLIGSWLLNVNQDLDKNSVAFQKNKEVASKWFQTVKMLNQ
tara:strand:- start:818 stop:2896 length:2079 start_codon:yes stop_codon:yes gene_type:complete